MRTELFSLVCLAVLASPAMADGPLQSHPVIREDIAKVKLDCVVRADGGLKDCLIVSASPAARSQAQQVVNRFETQVHLKPGQARPGSHKSFTYV